MREAFVLLAPILASIVGMGWLALAIDVHWRQIQGSAPRTSAAVKRLRVLGAMGLAAALVLCLSVDHASMASLVWVMALTAAALLIAFTLSWRPRWLRVLVPWLRRQGARKTQTLINGGGP